MPPITNKQAVMFDLDGTLLDTLEDLGDAMNLALREFGLPEHPYEFYRLAVGDGPRRLVARSLPPNQNGELKVTAAHDAMRRHYDANWHTKTRPYDGILDMLEALATRGVTLAILSNKPDPAVQKCVAHFMPPQFFAAIRGVFPDGPIKPDPQAATAILEALEIPHEAWLYVGDTNTDMLTAKAAGIFAVGCTWGFRDRDELVAAGADAIIDHPSELLALCQS